MDVSAQQKWHKVLYKKQKVPDNFVDESFLKDLKKNLYVKTYTVKEAIINSCVVTQEISSIIIFVIVFAYMQMDQLSSVVLFSSGTIVTAVLYVVYICMTPRAIVQTGLSDLKSVTIFLFFGFGLSPILKTLTQTISTDTIYAMSLAMMLVHLIFYDYGSPAAIVSSSVSLNAALFSAICLASRLPNVECAFSLLTFSVQVFALFPIFRRRLETYPKISLLSTLLLVVMALGSISTISVSNAWLLLLVMIFLNIVCPVWFVKWQHYKENLYGPWDEAVLHLDKGRA